MGPLRLSQTTTVVFPASLAFTITSRGEITTTSAILGSADATVLMSLGNCSNSPRPVTRVRVRVAWGGCAGAGSPPAGTVSWAAAVRDRETRAEKNKNRPTTADGGCPLRLVMKNFLDVFVAAKHFDNRPGRWRLLLGGRYFRRG